MFKFFKSIRPKKNAEYQPLSGEEPTNNEPRKDEDLITKETIEEPKQEPENFSSLATGDLLIHKYRVIAELGDGQFGKVLHCWDNDENKFVAIKINKYLSNRASLLNEIAVLQHIHGSGINDPRREAIIDLSSHHFSSDNSPHEFLVFHTIGQDLFTYMERKYRFGMPIDKSKRIMMQVLQGLDYLHTECKIIHTDLKPENILICYDESYIKKKANGNTGCYLDSLKASLSNLSLSKTPEENPSLLDSDVNENLKCEFESDKKYFPWKNQLLQLDITPGEIPHDWENSLKIKICDFGNALFADRSCNGTIQTREFRALEVILGADYNTPVDIWSAACIAFELVTGRLLFDPLQVKLSQGYWYLEDDEIHLAEIMLTLGKIPEAVIRSGKWAHRFFDDSGELRQAKCLDQYQILSKPLLDKILYLNKMSQTEAKIFCDFVHILLTYDPKLRATASHALEHAWLKQ